MFVLWTEADLSNTTFIYPNTSTQYFQRGLNNQYTILISIFEEALTIPNAIIIKGQENPDFFAPGTFGGFPNNPVASSGTFGTCPDGPEFWKIP